MPKRIKTKPATRKRKTTAEPCEAATGRPRAAAKKRPPLVEQTSPEHEAAYVETLIETGQAARLTPDGKLPAGATHKIVEDDQGKVKAVRRRFSIT